MLTKESALQVLNTIMDMYPDAVPTMRYNNPFELLVVMILSAQATDASVDKVTKNYSKDTLTLRLSLILHQKKLKVISILLVYFVIKPSIFSKVVIN